MSNVGNWIAEICTTVGTGDLTLLGTEPGFSRFQGAIPAGEVWYSILDGSNREAGRGTFDGSNTITRDRVFAALNNGVYSTNGNPIDLSGESHVFCTFNKAAYDEILSRLTGLEGNPVGAFSNFNVDRFADGVDYTAGTTTQLVLSGSAGIEQNTWVSFDGVVQHKSSYTLTNGVQIDFSSPITAGTLEVEVVYGNALTVTDVETSKAEASASAAAAATSEANASTSESNAAASEANAATSEINAGNSAAAAATSETNAATSATNAATSESNAAASASLAEDWAQEAGGRILTDMTLNVATTGNDTTGDGSVALPWASPHRALEWLSERIIGYGVTVTISVLAGTYTFTTPIRLTHPNGARIRMVATAATTFNMNGCSGLVSEGGGCLGISDNITYQGNGTGYGVYVSGDASTLSSGSITLASGTVVDGFSSGLYTLYGGSIFADGATVTNNNFYGIYTMHGGNINADGATVTGNGNNGLYARYGGSIAFKQGVVTNNGGYGIRTWYGGSIYASGVTIDTSNANATDVQSLHGGSIYINQPGVFNVAAGVVCSPAWGTLGNGNSFIGE